MDLRQLRYFIAIVDSGSLSRAAERVYIAQPSLSQQVATMEDDLGVPLLLRSSQGVAPTEAGLTLYRHARQMLRQMEQLRAEVGCSAGEVGRVSIGLPTSVTSVLAVPLYDALHEAHPGIRLHLVESMSGNLADLLVSGRLDMAVLFKEADSRGLHVHPLLWDSLSLFATASTLRQAGLGGSVSPEGAAAVPLVLPGPGNALRQLIERIFAHAGCELDVVADVDALPILLELASRDNVGTILSTSLSYLAQRVGLSNLRLTGADTRRPVSLCWPSAAPASAAVQVTRRVVADVCRKLIATDRWPGATLGADSTVDAPAVIG